MKPLKIRKFKKKKKIKKIKKKFFYIFEQIWENPGIHTENSEHHKQQQPNHDKS